MCPPGVHGPDPGPSTEFSEFFRAEYPRVVRSLTAAGVTVEEAKDIAQDAMLELLRFWSHLDKPHAWVRTVAWHRFLKVADRNRRRVSREKRDAQLGVPAGSAHRDPDEVSRVRACLRQLPPRQAAVVALIMDGYATHEIAALLKTEVATVRSHLRHARKTLQPLLDEFGSKDAS